MAACSDVSAEIPEKKARLTPPTTSDGDQTDMDHGRPSSSAETAGPSHEHDDNVSEISNLSGLEDEMQENRWRPNQGPMAWIQLKMLSGADPRSVLKELLPANMIIPDHVDSMTLWRLVFEILSEPPRRKKLKTVNTLDDAVNLIKSCKRIVVLTGAGISVSCGIPDFRSKDGIYAKLAVEYPDLAEPQDMFDINFFSKNPKPFFKFASEIYPGKFTPSVSHKFIRHLDDSEKLLRNYTQNIDTLEQCAGIKNVIQCHGSFATAKCMVCKYQVKSDDIKDDIMKQQIPKCPKCPPEETRAVMKPDIVFFGEGLPEEFHKQMEMDKDQCDLLIVMGSSLKVRPVALIPNSLPAHVPQILINREPLRHLTFDVELLGNCDVIMETLAERLGWSDLHGKTALTEVGHEVLTNPSDEHPFERDVVDDESTCDSVIETIKECHLCGSTEECAHTPDNSERKEVATKAKANGDVTKASGDVAKESGNVNKESGNVNKESDDVESKQATSSAEFVENNVPDTELVSHDMDLSGTSDHYDRQERTSLAEQLPPGSFVYLPPNRYLFPGGELMNYNPTADSDDDSSNDSESEDDDSPDDKPKHEEETESKAKL